LSQLVARITLAMPLHDLGLQLINLAVKFFEVIQQSLDQQTK
jgi:hypothetical protein